MEAHRLTDTTNEVPLVDHPAFVALSRDVHNLEHEQRESSEMFGKIMQAVTNVANNAAALDATVKAHLGHIDRRFTELRDDMLRQCIVRHNGVDGRIDKLENQDREIVRDVRTMSEDSKVHEIAALRSQLDARKKKQTEAAKEARDNRTYWQRYRVTVTVGVLMALLGAGLGLVSSTLNRPAPAPAAAPPASR